MATTPKTTTKVVEQCRVSPPAATVSPTTLPLTFFDVVWLFTGHVKRILFYQSTSITTNEFLRSHLPSLRHSLSLTLQSFFSLAGNLVMRDLTIEYADGDSVTVSVAESNADFAALMADEAKDVTLTHPLVPVLPSAPHEPGRSPLLALQFTVFPGAGFTLGITFHHAAADGNSIHRFLKSWAAIHRSGGDLSSAPDAPVYERGSLLELEDDKKGFLGDVMRVNPAAMETRMEELPAKTTASSLGHDGQTVRATFVLTRDLIEKLRDQISSVTGARPSTFVAACAHVWTRLIEACEEADETVYFSFVGDCRARIDPPLADTYFGNCISGVLCEARRAELTGPDGLIMASNVIHQGIRALEGRAVVGMREVARKYMKLLGKRVPSVAGSPYLQVYDTDFGWGSPKKTDLISIEGSGAISLADSRAGDGGLEIGMAGPLSELERFGNIIKASP